MDTKVHGQSLRRVALHGVEYWLKAEFGRSSNLPIIRLAPPGSQSTLILDQIYRAMLDYLFHWALETQGYHLTHHELTDTLIRIARDYRKVEQQPSATPPR